MLLFLPAGTARRAGYAIFFPYGGRAISIFFQLTQFLETVEVAATAGGERMLPFIFPFHFFADPAKHPAGQLLRPPACLPAQLVVPACRLTPGSRGGRPVSARPIGKQRPKMYFPVSFPSSTSKHSNGSRKNAVRPQFLLMMIYYHFAATSSAAKI